MSVKVFTSLDRTEISSSDGDVFIVQYSVNADTQQVSFPKEFLGIIIEALREAASEAGDAS